MALGIISQAQRLGAVIDWKFYGSPKSSHVVNEYIQSERGKKSDTETIGRSQITLVIYLLLELIIGSL